MLNFGASKPRVRGGGPGPRGPPLDPHLKTWDNVLCLVTITKSLHFNHDNDDLC